MAIYLEELGSNHLTLEVQASVFRRHEKEITMAQMESLTSFTVTTLEGGTSM